MNESVAPSPETYPYKISAFTLIKNAINFDYPVVESINSLLPMVDEYVINVGDSDDGTRELIQDNFGDNPKCVIFDSVWEKPEDGTNFFSNQTNKALEKCTGDWCFYLQADECVHEDEFNQIKESIDFCEKNNKIAIVFKYYHFEKNYDSLRKTYSEGFDCYEDEVRVFKNNIGVVSWGDAQGFCLNDAQRFAVSLRKYENDIYCPDLHIYHYGYVKSAKKMLDKKKALNEFYFNEAHFSEEQKQRELAKIKNAKDEYEFSFQLNDFNGTHPTSMRERIERFCRENPELLLD